MRQYTWRPWGTRAVHVAVFLTDSDFYDKGRVIYDSGRKAGGCRPSTGLCRRECDVVSGPGDDYGLQKYLDEVEARKEALDNGRIS